MKLTARNQLEGRVISVRLGGIMAKVTVDIGGGKTLTSAITRGTAEALDLKEGDEGTAIIKATEIILGK